MADNEEDKRSREEEHLVGVSVRNWGMVRFIRINRHLANECGI